MFTFTTHRNFTIRTLTSAGILSLTSLASAAPVDFVASGGSSADLLLTVTAFNSAISLGGGNNGVAGGPHVVGRREVNWDAAGLDAFQSPNAMPDNFFNNNSKRGVNLTAESGRLLVSRRVADGSARFGDVDSSYNTSFQTFSPLRLFGVENGTNVNSTFFVPNAPTQAATINGFGAVFTDVDRTDSTAIEFFTELNGANVLLRRLMVPASSNGGVSFAGTFFGDGERISLVRVISGNIGLGAGVVDSNINDVVAMDDFFYSEPLAVPAPASLAVLLPLLTGRRRR